MSLGEGVVWAGGLRKRPGANHAAWSTGQEGGPPASGLSSGPSSCQTSVCGRAVTAACRILDLTLCEDRPWRRPVGDCLHPPRDLPLRLRSCPRDGRRCAVQDVAQSDGVQPRRLAETQEPRGARSAPPEPQKACPTATYAARRRLSLAVPRCRRPADPPDTPATIRLPRLAVRTGSPLRRLPSVHLQDLQHQAPDHEHDDPHGHPEAPVAKRQVL